ncbi:MAG TPA: N-acetylmuramoyl-L-alanine amidase, partial [Candidatus Limnocylindria bacterium]|nr:N-acetylmuramoyl-L-alanine amidase [Candidatus Limnocylindria bacterium]
VAASDGRAVTLRLSSAIKPTAVPVRTVGGVDRLHVDLPPGTRLAPGVRRVVAGEPPLLRARIGQVGDGRSRLVLDTSRGARFRLETADGGRTLTVVVARPAPALTAAAARAPVAARAALPPETARKARAPAPARPRPLRVVLDAGHGGDDPGAIGYVVEKHVTLDIVRRVARQLREQLGAEVVLTRSSDTTVPLAERTAIANQARADLFVSIHANANPGGRSKGIQTYVLDDASDAAALRLAAIENGTDHQPYHAAPTDLRYILSSLVQGGKMPDSSRLAHAIQRELVGHMRARYPGVEDLGVRRGPFYVLVGSHMPCVLVETSFVTHPTEGRRLADEAYRAALADGLVRGIRRFLFERRSAGTL